MTEERRTGFWYAAVTALLALLVTGGFLFAAVSFSFQERRSEFNSEAAYHERAMEGQLLRLLDAMGQAMIHHQATPRAGADDFRLFAWQVRRRFPFVSGFAYLARVEGEERPAFEAARRDEGMPTFAIRDRAGDGFAPAPERKDYLPVQAVEPFDPERAALLGFDLEEAEDYRAGLEAAMSAGSPIILRGPGLFSEWHEFWLVQAVYRGRDLPETEAERRERVAGILMLRIEPEKAISAELARLKEVEFTLLAMEDDHPAAIVAHRDTRSGHRHDTGTFGEYRLLFMDNVQVGGIKLQFRFERQLHPPDLLGPPVWLALGASGLVSLFLGLLAREHFRRRRAYAALDLHREQLERLVEARTAELQRQNALLECVDRLRRRFIHGEEPEALFDAFLADVIALSGSGIGFIGEVEAAADGRPLLHIHSLSNIAWNDATRILYEERMSMGLVFDNMETLFGHVMVTGQPMIANDPANDPRAGGLPEGHPPIHSFLGLPIHFGDRLVGEIGLANRPGGYSGEIVGFLAPLVAACGQVMVARQDREARAAAEAALGRTAAELKATNMELQQFAYAVSHDLQEPLRTVTSYLQLTEKRFRDKLGDEGREFITFAVDASRRMQTMIRDLLEYSRVQTRPGEMLPVDLDDTLATVERNLHMALDEASAKLTVVSHLPIVVADEAQMIRLFQNLIGNAIKYRLPERPPEVAVSCERREGHWLFSVRDNGIGIDPKYFDRIFGVFTRLHTREEYEGTGIGLALCRRIVERHGGTIWVESDPGQGSTFHFTLKATG